ncbi:RagB/SusD family nutrient uptake outer membrane protein [Dysgonomonas macrotermitis]|nr:RagB/SusD family nutrient uptake outer membrane protein [Dysgonomonas macrotermitis]
MLTGCEDLLDSTNYTESNTGNFPNGVKDAEMLVTATYSTLNKATGATGSSYFFVSELAADDRMGGGSEDDKGPLGIAHLLKADDSQFNDFWVIRYMGIARANDAIQALSSLELEDTSARDQLLGESLFLRAFFYSELVEMFGGVPIIITPGQEFNIPRASADEVYAQITEDLKEAIGIMSSTKKYNEFESGRITRWAAQALMARNFLFYTGFYGKDELPLAGGRNVTKTEVVSWLEDCRDNSGHGLVGDFRNLWTYTNEHTKDDYPYTKDVVGIDGAPLAWVGNENKETIFSVKYANYSGWDAYQIGYTNQYILCFGMRGDVGKNGKEDTFPFGQGWGLGPISSTIWDDWNINEPDDLRRRASILNIADATEGVNYVYEGTAQMEECGYWNKKMSPISSKDAVEKYDWPNTFWMVYPEYDVSTVGEHMQGAHFQDLIVIRFADVLLMHSELTGTADGMNQVRARAGLTAKGYTLESLQRERRYELCFEGRRWADIRRWHIAEEALAKKNGITVRNKGEYKQINNGGYVERYKATNGFWPLPKTQIDLSNGILQQNTGWTGSDANYTGWNFN